MDTEIDTGLILRQASVPVLSGDTEATRSAHILEQEHKLNPQALLRLR